MYTRKYHALTHTHTDKDPSYPMPPTTHRSQHNSFYSPIYTHSLTRKIFASAKHNTKLSQPSRALFTRTKATLKKIVHHTIYTHPRRTHGRTDARRQSADQTRGKPHCDDRQIINITSSTMMGSPSPTSNSTPYTHLPSATSPSPHNTTDRRALTKKCIYIYTYTSPWWCIYIIFFSLIIITPTAGTNTTRLVFYEALNPYTFILLISTLCSRLSATNPKKPSRDENEVSIHWTMLPAKRA